MIQSLIQFDDGMRGVALLRDGSARRIKGFTTTADLARAALAAGTPLADFAAGLVGEPLNLRMVEKLAPIDLPNPTRLHVTDTGPVQAIRPDRFRPEWRYRGDGGTLVASGKPLPLPDFAFDGSERPEIAGLYSVGADRLPVRIGFLLGNRFSDFAAARTHRHWPAQLSPRSTALAPELLLGDLPDTVCVTSRLLRDGVVHRERSFTTGDAVLPQTIAALEQRRFGDGIVGRPGDIHVHFFATATPQPADAVRTQPGDAFEVLAAPFTYALRNPITLADPVRAKVRAF